MNIDKYDKINFTLNLAIKNLFTHQENIFEYTSETNQTEWNLAHHLAVEIHKIFPEYDCDLDVVKPNYDNKRPDIVFHKRGINDCNFLVVELKKDGSSADLEGALNKIKKFWFQPPLKYQYGAAINLNSDKTFQIRIEVNKENSL